MQNLSVLVGVCTGGTMRSETVSDMIGAMKVLENNGVNVDLCIQIGGYVAHNRNNLVSTAKERGATHLMFIDNDMKFKPSAIQRLIDADKDIIGVNYNARGVPGKPSISTVKLLDAQGNLPNDGSTREFEVGPALFKVGALGTGFMLIKMSVFEKLIRPYFVAFEEEGGEHHTEDVEFCIRAREAGYDVYCNPTIKILHIGTYEY
jgi:GT2 family glycosyltransferase